MTGTQPQHTAGKYKLEMLPRKVFKVLLGIWAYHLKKKSFKVVCYLIRNGTLIWFSDDFVLIFFQIECNFNVLLLNKLAVVYLVKHFY